MFKFLLSELKIGEVKPLPKKGKKEEKKGSEGGQQQSQQPKQ